jgi:hypothetical protein
MPELNFDALREAVENDTFLPEFTEIRRRARRHKRWRRLVNTARILGVLVVATPGLAIVDVVFTHIYRPVDSTGVAAGPDAGDLDSAPITGSTVTSGNSVISSVVDVAGIDGAHAYALVDVCLVHACNLQLSQINPTSTSPTPQSVGLIRAAPTQTLANPRLVLVNASTASVSAIPAGDPRAQVSITITPAPGKIASTPRPVQISVLGAIGMVTGAAGVPQSIPSQPNVSGPELVSTLDGWWVTGTMPTGELGISVSHDDGATWTVHSTGVKPLPATAGGASNSAFATTDGTDMFVLARTAAGMKMLYSTDAGATWHPISADVLWPVSTSFSLVATANGEVIASFTSGSTTTYLSSSNYGGKFRTMAGAPVETGNVVRIGNELITLGTHSQISTDGINWQEALIPTVAPNTN